MTRTTAPSLRTLLNNLVDYAGLFPPAALSLDLAAENYARYLRSVHSWMVGRFVVPAAEFARLPQGDGWRITVLSENEVPGADSVETKTIRKLSMPTYCEIPLGDLKSLPEIARIGAYAKMRTGGLTPDAIPPSGAITGFLCACAQARLPFKATAGLHHPVRADQPLTYAVNPPRATMHGFVNVFLAAAFAWHGSDEETIARLLDETDSGAFQFDDGARWRDATLTGDQIADARRNFAHSFGSCSFEEPVSDLRKLGWLA